MKLSDRIREQYRSEILERFEKLKPNENYMIRIDESSNLIEEVHYGNVADFGNSVFIFPSGKYYTLWTTNQTRSDVFRDMIYREELEKIAEDYDFSFCPSTSDPTEIFLIRTIDLEGEYYWTKDEEIFYRGSEKIGSSQDVLDDMEQEGYYPAAAYVGNYGEVFRYCDLQKLSEEQNETI